MKVLMFKPRFAELVRTGVKRQTIRPHRKRRFKVGDLISLREWTGKPYASKQRCLIAVTCIGVEDVAIYELPRRLKDGTQDGVVIHVRVGGRELDLKEMEDFAIADGFRNTNNSPDPFAHSIGKSAFFQMYTFFKDTHGLPFEGDLVKW